MDESDARLDRLEQRLVDIEYRLRNLERRLDLLAPGAKPQPAEPRHDVADYLNKVREARQKRDDLKREEEAKKEQQSAAAFELDLSSLAGEEAAAPREVKPPAPPESAPGPIIAKTPPAAAPPAESGLTALAANLRQLGILPPERTGSLEGQIGSWWMTRIGMLLGVIGVASFGIYITRNTPAWVRLAELVFFSGAITAAGWWLERKLPRFGEVVFGGGLALLYFSAFGAYAIPGIKVIDDPTAALFAQLAVVVVIGLLALLRRSQPLSMMSAVFGFAACLFSVRWGLDWSALATALVIHAGAIYLFLSRGWFQPLFVSIAGVWVIYGATFYLHWLTRVPAGFERAIVYLACVMSATIAADWFSLKLEKTPPRQPRLIMQYLNTSGALALAWLVTYVLYHNQLQYTYFVFGAILLAASVAYYLTGADFNLMHGFFIKATAFITLGVIVYFGDYSRFVALAVQSAILLASAWRTRLKVTEYATIAVWSASLVFLFDDILPINTPVMLIFAREGLLSLAWLAISAVVLGFYARLFGSKDDEVRRPVLIVMGVALGMGAMMIGLMLVETQWRPIALSALSAALAIYALVPRHWITLIAALPPLAIAHLTQWTFVRGADLQIAWLNESVVVGFTFAAAVCLNLVIRRSPRLHSNIQLRQIVWFAHMLWMLTLFSVPFHTFGLEEFILMGVAVSWLASGLAFLENAALPARLSFWPMVYVLLLFAHARFNEVNTLPVIHFDPYFYIAIIGAFAHVLGTWRPGPLRDRIGADGNARVPQFLHLCVVVLLVHVALLQIFKGDNLLWAYCLAAIAFGSLAWLTEIRPGLLGAIYFIVAGHGSCYWWRLDPSLLLPGLMIGALTLCLAPALRRLPTPPTHHSLRVYQWTVAIAALVLMDLLFLNQTGPRWTHFITVAWGIAAVIVVAAGFLDRAKPLRLVGLAGLAICIPRAFAVDIKDWFYRIAAFIILGAALLVVGYIYTKYEKLLDRTEEG